MQMSVVAYVRNMERAVAFYESLGFTRRGDMNPMWNEFAFGDTIFALHRTMTEELPLASDRLTLNMIVSHGELERLHALCEERGYPTSGPIQDIGFGPFFRVDDPDGLPVQFSERRAR